MPDLHANFGYSTVLTAPSPASSGTSLAVQTGDGSNFPTAPFNAVVWPAGVSPTPINAEIVRVSAGGGGGGGDTFTITRTQEGTSARTIGVGDQIIAAITAKTMSDVEGPRQPSTDNIVQANYSEVIPYDYEVAANVVLEIGSNGCMEIL